MKLGDPIKPFSQPIDKGTLVRLFQCPDCTDPSPLKGGLGIVTGKMLHSSLANTYLGIEAGFGVRTSNAETTWAKKGKMLRKAIRIDKCPWPDGQEAIKIFLTLNYAQSVGGLGTQSSGSTTQHNILWHRNTSLHLSASAFAPDNPFQQAFGFNGGSGGCDFDLTAHGVGAGRPLVQDDGNPCTETYVQLISSNPTWPYGPTWQIANFGDSSAMTTTALLPCPQWANQQIRFPGGPFFYEAASFVFGPIGLVMSIDWIIGVEGTAGFDPFLGVPDPASWVDGTDDDGD